MASKKGPNRAAWIVAIAGALVPLALLAFVGWRVVKARPFVVPQSAMAPAIYGGQQICVDASAYGLHLPLLGRVSEGALPSRGDVIVFDWPSDRTFIYVMRVVAIGGDEVRLDPDGSVIIDGQPLSRCSLGPWPAGTDPNGHSDGSHATLEQSGERSYVVLKSPGGAATRAAGKLCVAAPCTVPPGQLLVLGDSRDASSDSRDWGFVPVDHLIGRALAALPGDTPGAPPERALTGTPSVPPQLQSALERCQAR